MTAHIPPPVEPGPDWLQRTVGRQLKAPAAGTSRISLPEWMLRSSDAHRQARGPAPDLALPRHKGQTRHTLARMQPIVPSTPKDCRCPSSSGARRLHDGISNNRARKTISLELQRRKRLHPRLRWPRLARDEHAADGDPGIIKDPPELVADCVRDEPLEFMVSKIYSEDDLAAPKRMLGPDVIPEDSIFYPGEPMPTEPAWNIINWKSNFNSTEASLLPRIGGRNPNIGSQAKSAKSDEVASRPALLAPAHPHAVLAAGKSATVHLPRLDGCAVDQKSRAKNGAPCSTDRKYYIRQAPVSHIMARELAVFDGISNGMKHLSKEKSGHAEIQANSTEYLNFESWGIDDGYVKLLCERANLDKIKFMNLSDNRLTERSIQAMSQVGESAWLIQSLQLSKNKLLERGGRAVAHFIDNIRPPLRELDLSDNFIGDKACEELCEVLSSRCAYLVGLSLARNELGHVDKVGTALGHVLETARDLEMLDLHWNFFHGSSTIGLLSGLYENSVHTGGNLRRLNLAWNRLGMRCNDYNQQVSENRQPAQPTCTCSVCSSCTRMTRRLASIFQDGEVLFHLDLSHNGLSAGDCSVLSEGLKNNHTLFGLHLIGNDASVDELGFVVPSLPNQSIDSEDRQDRLNRMTENIPAKLRLDMTPMAIVDRSGRLNKDEVAESSLSRVQSPVLSTSSGDNMKDRSLLHSPMSGVSLQSTKTKVPKSTEVAPELGLFGGYRVSPSLRGLNNQTAAGWPTALHPPAFSKEDVLLEKQWVAARTKAQQPLEFCLGVCEDVRRDARCCWICENWIEQRVSYIPGWSGPEGSAEEVAVVFAYFSIDGFSRATKLTRTEEPYQRRMFEAERRGNMRQFGRRQRGRINMHRPTILLGRRPVPCLTEQGRIVRWTGSRMLPPTTVPIQVVFQVNDRIVVADDLPVRPLAAKKALRLHAPDDGCVPSVPIASGSQGNVIPSGEDADPSIVEISDVNVMSVGLSAWERFELGEATALLILEDPLRRGEINVLPRKIQEVRCPPVVESWSFGKSEFNAFRLDTSSLGEELLEHDWNLTKLDGALKYPQVVENVYNFLRTHYLQLVLAYQHYAFFGFRSKQYSPGLVYLAFTDLMADYGGTHGETHGLGVGGRTGARKTRAHMRPRTSQEHRETPPPTPGASLFNRNFGFGDSDTVFIASSVVDKEKRRGLVGMPEKGLARFQFLEAFVRIAIRRFSDECTDGDASAAVKALWRYTSMGQDLLDLRRELHQNLFCEECDLVFKEYRYMLEGVYLTYKEVHCYPGRIGAGLSYGAWDQLLQDANVADCGVSMREAGLAFAMGKELRLDEYTNMRHMELSWAEFLVCLGALMTLRADFEKEFFADMLADFFSDHLSNARQSRLDTSQWAHSASQDGGLTQVLMLVGKVFADADEDNSGTLTVHEFRRCLAQQQVQQEIRELGIPIEDIGTYFSYIDKDQSGEVTLDELCEGFIKLKLSMQGVDRSIAYFRKAFAEADLDGSGTLSMHEFKQLCSNPRVQKRLAALGVQIGEIETLFESISLRRGGHGTNTGNTIGRTLTGDDMIAGFLAIREVGLGESRGVNCLRQAFLEADVNGTNSLDREEMRRAFCTEKLSQKLQKLLLKEPNWMEIFDSLDTDGNGDISWSELSQGVCQLWRQAIEEDVIDHAKTVASIGVPASTSVSRASTLQFGTQPTLLSREISSFSLSREISSGAFAVAQSSVTHGAQPSVSRVNTTHTPSTSSLQVPLQLSTGQTAESPV